MQKKNNIIYFNFFIRLKKQTHFYVHEIHLKIA
jgi:hypothetical protein